MSHELRGWGCDGNPGDAAGDTGGCWAGTSGMMDRAPTHHPGSIASTHQPNASPDPLPWLHQPNPPLKPTTALLALRSLPFPFPEDINPVSAAKEEKSKCHICGDGSIEGVLIVAENILTLFTYLVPSPRHV